MADNAVISLSRLLTRVFLVFAIHRNPTHQLWFSLYSIFLNEWQQYLLAFDGYLKVGWQKLPFSRAKAKQGKIKNG